MDISTINESYQFNEILVKNFTDLQSILGTLVLVLTPVWLLIRFGIRKLYKSFLWNKSILKVTNVVFGVNSPHQKFLDLAYNA